MYIEGLIDKHGKEHTGCVRVHQGRLDRRGNSRCPSSSPGGIQFRFVEEVEHRRNHWTGLFYIGTDTAYVMCELQRVARAMIHAAVLGLGRSSEKKKEKNAPVRRDRARDHGRDRATCVLEGGASRTQNLTR